MTDEEVEKLSVAEWTKLMNDQVTPSGPGVAKLDMDDDTRRPDVLDIPEDPEDRTVEDWAKLMGADSRNNHAVNLLDND